MEKILFISNIAKKIGSFSIASIDAAKECGMQFQMAANWSGAGKEQIESDQKDYNVKIHNIPIARSPYSPQNKKAYKQLIEIIRQEHIDYIHCNTPVGGVLGRLAGKKCGVKKVIYQAHGFHFYKGAPLKNWLLYYPVERFLAHWTDAIITINQEDYVRAQKFRLRNHGKVYYVPGVGIDATKYLTDKKSRMEKRAELGLAEDEVALVSMGDLIIRKNYPVAIEALAKINNPKVHYYICGQGSEKDKLKRMAEKLGIDRQVHFLGYRTDIKELLNASDIFLFTTLQEGLSRSLMEAMASGLPCIASNIRGNIDLLKGEKGGFLVPVDDANVVADRIIQLAGDAELRKKMSQENLKRILDFSTGKVKREIEDLYETEVVRGGEAKLIDFVPCKYRKRAELGIAFDQFVIISVGEINANKNNRIVIEAIAKTGRKDIHYLLCGIGAEQPHLKELSEKLGIQNQIHFLGYQSDVPELYQAADVFALPSFREGLSRSLMEAMASGLPCIVSNIRGNRDLIKNGQGGYLYNPQNIEDVSNTILTLFKASKDGKEIGKINMQKVKEFDRDLVCQTMTHIYQEIGD